MYDIRHRVMLEQCKSQRYAMQTLRRATAIWGRQLQLSAGQVQCKSIDEQMK